MPVALLDVAKGFVPAALGLWLGGDWVGVLAGAAAMVGHARPVFLGFSKGGKMVATAGGVAFALAPLAAICCLVLWVVSFAAFRYASVSSMIAAVALPVLCYAFGASWPIVAFTSVAAVRRPRPAPAEHPAAARRHRAPVHARRGAVTLTSSRSLTKIRPGTVVWRKGSP